jgi:hypothetical protein
MGRLLPATATVAVLSVLAAAPADAIDLTGTWENVKHTTCAGLTATGEKVALKNRAFVFPDLPITQSGIDLHMNIPGYLWRFEGRVYEEAGETTRGQGYLQKCPGGIPNAFATHRVTKAETFPETSKGVSGKMTTVFTYGSDTETYSCTISWQRVSLVDPESEPCI